MPDDPRIHRRVEEILIGSGLPADRRADIAEELRAHLEQLVEAKLSSGLTEDAAIQAALSQFGKPAALRSQLRQQHRLREHREAIDVLRSKRIALCLLALAPGLVPAIDHGLTHGPLRLVIGLALAGVVLGLFLFVSLSLVLYPLVRFRIQFHAPVPAQEGSNVVVRLIARSGAVFVSLLGSEIVLGAGSVAWFGVVTWLSPLPPSTINILHLSRDFAADFFPNATPLMAVIAGLAGLVVMVLEYRRGRRRSVMPA